MRNRPLLSGCLILFLLITFGIITGGARFVKELRPSVLEKEISGEVNIRLSGQVYDIDDKEKYQILYLKNNSIIYQNKSFKESKIILYDEEKLNIEIGNRIAALGTLSFYEEERNPGNFNQKLYYQKQGIKASVWANEITVTDFCVDRLGNMVYSIRNLWKEKLYEAMGEEDGAILSAMLLGEKAGMDEETKELYQANGIGHILAISGLHLSVIGVGIYKVFRRLSGSYLAGGLAGIAFLFLYILMIGISVSVLRALIMFLFRVGADMTGRHYDSPTALSVAALVTIIWNPLCLYDGGFWLSYGAILAIILVFPLFEELIFQSVWASVSINLVTLPVLLYYFYEIPLYSVLLNLFVIPLMTVVIMCGLLGSVLVLIPFVKQLGSFALWVCGIVFDFYETGCRFFLKLPAARLVAGQPEMWQIIIYYSCLLYLVVMWRKKRRWCVGSVMVVLATVLLLAPVGEQERVSVTVLDVGQGDGIFIKGPEGSTYLIDGGSSDVKKVGRYRIESFLKSQGVGKIDYVFVSHGDGDHISGITEMIERMNMGVYIETIVFPSRSVWDEKLIELAGLAMENGIRVAVVEAGQKLSEGKMTLTCLAPGEDLGTAAEKEGAYSENSNASSMVLALRYGKFDMLFTGDVEAEGEELLTEVLKECYENVKWDVLKVAHHGSKNSSKEEFLEVVMPSYSLISAGRDNSYGHPHAETLERLESVESKIMSTQECGAITVVTDGEKMNVERYLKGEWSDE